MLKRLRAKPLWIIFSIVLFDLLGFGIVIPILPLLFTDPASPFSLLGTNLSIDTGYILFGLLIASYPFFQFLSAPVLGQLSDQYGRRPLLLFTLSGITISNLLFAVALIMRNIPLLFVSKILGGLTGGNISVAQAMVADISNPQERTKHFGMLGAGFGIGLILGPFIGGKLSDPSFVSWFTLDTPFWFVTVLNALNVLAVYFLLPETLQKSVSGHVVRFFQAFTNIFEAYRLKNFRVVFLVGFLYQAGFAFFTSFISVYLYKKFNFNQGSIGEFFAYAGIWIALTQLFITKFMVRRFSDTTIVKLGLGACAVSIFALFTLNASWQLYLLTTFFAIANGLVQTSILSIVSAMAPPTSQGKILGINSSMYALAQALPPLIAGFLAASVQTQTPLVVAGVITAVTTVIFIKKFKMSPIAVLQ